MQSRRVWRRYTLYGAALLALAACDQHPAPAVPAKPRVQIVTVKPEPLALFAELPGRIEAVRVAEVRARVAGVVLEQRFTEGADVKAGELLFVIDPAPLRAVLARAEGELARSAAQVQDTQARLKRAEALAGEGAVSGQDLDSARVSFSAAKAARQSAEADVETARLNLAYASVRAPISGRIGRALVTEGALVGQGEATLMARIQQLDPVYADFNQPVVDALRLREGQGTASGQAKLSLQVEGLPRQVEGTLLFSDVSVDRQTGQVSLRGRFPNPDHWLLPGMYVRVRVPQGNDPAAIIIPQRAVQRGQDGQAQVLAVAEDGTVQARAVETGAMLPDGWRITSGLAAGDKVIVGGQANVHPGDSVDAQLAAQP
ncbi:efflux RND transporter periplasmic adaptor subunit [Pseudomonas sp. RIT-PI-S]|uniref:efflux RND transporter periplasmic adaptor subunit n=1 Tax=Pseudomonas sp. RIT-PI-S TaxID=3035295 RepID=UPI0021D7DF0E|nr:efflux RND transporter periplasmic adaptor subunit [Pseudomonas sp. RIT-PI-S]